MSYLDKNPFNRPTPTFNTNANTFNTYSTYSTYDYLNSKKPQSYSSTYQNQYNHSPQYKYSQYKYSRAVQDSPFISGTNPFTMSTANINMSDNKSPSVSYYPSYQRDSYESKKQYPYSPSVSNVSGFTDPYQQPFFKTDQFQDRFKKSNFQLQLKKSRQNQPDFKYPSSTKQVQISKLLQNNPFQKPSLQSTKNNYLPYQSSQSKEYTQNYQQNYSAQSQYLNQYQNQNYGKTQNWKKHQNQVKFQERPFQQPRQNYQQSNQQDKYAHLIYKPSSLATSDVKKIKDFDQFSQKIPSSQSMNYLQIQKYQRQSEKGSRNTFINKISDLISSDNQQHNLPLQQSFQAKQKKSLKNPFSNSNNPFAKTSLISKKSQKSENQLIPKQLSISSQNSIKFEDFIDIETKMRESLKRQSQANFGKQWFKKSQDKLFESQGLRKSNAENVEEQFQKWGRQSGKKSLSIFESKKLRTGENDALYDSRQKSKENQFSKIKSRLQMNDKLQLMQQKNTKSNIVVDREIWNAYSSEEKNEEKVDKDGFSKKGSIKFEKEKEESFNKGEPFDKGLNKKQEVLRFSRQVFEDEDDEGESVVEEYRNREEDWGLKRISEVDFSQQRQSQPNSSKRESRIEQKPINTQSLHPIKFSEQVSQAINTEQKIDQKLSKYRYQYQKPQPTPSMRNQPLINQNSSHSHSNNPSQQYPQYQQNAAQIEPANIKVSQNHFNDFIDFDVEDHNDSFTGESSFQVVDKFNDNQDYNKTSSKRVNLKERVMSNLKNDSLPTQKIQPQFAPYKQPQNAYQDKKEGNVKEKYEFQSLDQFQGKYRYSMKQSGFDFEEDQFEETQRHLGLDEESNHNNDDKILIPENGYDEKDLNGTAFNTDKQQSKTKQNQEKNKELPLRRYISSISSNNDDVPKNHDKEDVSKSNFKNGITKNNEIKKEFTKDDNFKDDQEEFLPSFKVQASQRLHRLSEGQTKTVSAIQNDYQKLINNYTQQTPIYETQKYKEASLFDSQQKQNKLQLDRRKVPKVKIYQSESQAEPYRNSIEQSQRKQNPNHKQSLRVQNRMQNSKSSNPINSKNPKLFSSQASQIQESETQQYYKSPFQQKSSKIPSFQPVSKNQESPQNKNPFNKSQKHRIQNLYEEDLNEQSLKQTLKYPDRHQRDHSPTFNSVRQSQKSNKQPPVRDSFDFSNQVRQKANKSNKEPYQKYPKMLEHRGNIYHFIELIE